MSDPAFQEGVLKQLDGIMHVNDSDLKDAQQSIGPEVDRYVKQSRELDVTKVSARLTALQETLTFATNLSDYVKAHPEKAEAVGYVLALSQGPKGVLSLLVGEVVNSTSAGQNMSEKIEAAKTKAGTELAEYMLGIKDPEDYLKPSDKGDDSLIGGGKLIFDILTGGVPGRAKKETHITAGGGSVNDHRRGEKAGKTEKEKVEKEKAEKEKAEKERAEKEKAEKEKAEKEKSENAKAQLISQLPPGTKITPEDIVDIRKLQDGRVVWLEKGSDSAGLQHIYMRHETEFTKKGISREEVPGVVMSALERGEIVGTTGSANVYRISHNGVEQNIAIGVGSNGFVVRANPASKWKPLK